MDKTDDQASESSASRASGGPPLDDRSSNGRSPNGRSRGRDWFWVCLFTAAIFAAIPVARGIQSLVAGTAVGRQLFLAIVAVIAVFAVAGVLRSLYRRRVPRARYVWLAFVVAAFGFYGWELRSSPEEAVHFVLYGGLGALLFRALAHRVRDVSIYLAAIALGTLIGTVDETAQWLLPTRVWDIRDIFLNAVSVALMQVVIALVLRPVSIHPRPGGRGLRLTFALSAGVLFCLALAAINTPPRIGWYADRVPGLSYLKTKGNHMMEYGYLYRDPAIGTFRSRFAPGALQQIDSERGRVAGAILDRYPTRESMQAFDPLYTIVTDPFILEARIHLYRRDRYVERAGKAQIKNPQDSKTVRDLLTIAWRENLILEKYFPATFGNSSHRWSFAQRDRIRQANRPETAYDSAVSRHVVTSFPDWQLAGLLLAGMAGLLIAATWAGRR